MKVIEDEAYHIALHNAFFSPIVTSFYRVWDKLVIRLLHLRLPISKEREIPEETHIPYKGKSQN